MMMPFPEQCLKCKHLRRHAPGKAGIYCDAFPAPKLIPVEILEGYFDHAKPFPGDHGIQFEPIEEPAIAGPASP